MKLHGYIGLAIILTAEVLLFSGNTFVGHWFTPIVWTGYVLFIDAKNYLIATAGAPTSLVVAQCL